MGTGDLSLVVGPRLKREDYKRTKHDAVFSKWQVLIGHSDWEDYSQGKEGVARYRVHNLPTTSSPGLYELGVVVTLPNANQSDPVCTRSGRDADRLDQDGILVVYLGQADCVRTRLQRYGRSGAHLRNVNLFSDVGSDLSGSDNESLENDTYGVSLFEEMFSRGGSIVYRWGPMKTKRDAEETEAQLLQTFDYAWNKGSNGERRIDESLVKLTKMALTAGRLLGISRMLLPFPQKQVGIKIEGNRKILLEEKMPNNADAAGKNHNFLAAIFKLTQSRPKVVSSDRCDIDLDSGPTCGFIMRGGVSCPRTPVKGRKRCKEHKGMRIYGFTSKPSKEGCDPSKNSTNGFPGSDITCGVIEINGESCRKRPISGRKRCEEHKGMKFDALLVRLSLKEKLAKAETIKNAKIDPKLSFNEHEVHGQDVLTCCGATTKSGSACRRIAAKGSRRCWQHCEQTCDDNGVKMAVCGVNLSDGSTCERAPVKGRKRCGQHKGMRITPSW